MSEKFSAMQNSADLSGSADSLGENQDSPSLEQLNYRGKVQGKQRKLHETIENEEHLKADLDLKKEIYSMEISNEIELNNFLIKNFPDEPKANLIAQEVFDKNNQIGRKLNPSELLKTINDGLDNNAELSTEDKIKNFTESIRQGKSQTEILQLLISKFENEESVSTWVENWRNFQKLHNFAESKPPAERQAIQNIISQADFSSENAFETSLSQISQSAEISNETKLEISREFGGSHIDSVDGMDFQLKQVKEHTKAIEKEIGVKFREKKSLDSEIESLENEITNLPLGSPKRQELEDELEQKKGVLKQTKKEIDRLEKGKPKDVSFTLRKGFSAKLNKDGSRSIKIDSADFAIKLPSNKWLFSDKKNMRAINLTFPYLALKNQNLAGLIFRPNLENNSIPSIENRKMGHLILSSLGFDDTKILNEENIKQLKKDLAFLSPKNGKTRQENLIELGVFDVGSQSLDKRKLKKSLIFIRENRNLENEAIFEEIKNL